MLNELDPQVKALLEQFQANAARHPTPATPLSQKEKIMATREMINAYAALRYPSDLVSRTGDFVIPGPVGKIPVRLYVPHTIMLSTARGIREDLLAIAAPVLVYYHGGGFVAGDLESHDTLLRALANRSQPETFSLRVEGLKPARTRRTAARTRNGHPPITTPD